MPTRNPTETCQRVMQQHVHDLIDDFAKLPRRNSDVHGGQHFGLVRSVWVSILRMQARCKTAKQATMLLAALAVLHPTRTPKRIFDHTHVSAQTLAHSEFNVGPQLNSCVFSFCTGSLQAISAALACRKQWKHLSVLGFCTAWRIHS